MKFVTTKGNSPLSILIRKATGGKASHFAFVFDNGFVFHSNLLGVHPQWLKTFLKKASVVDEVTYDCGFVVEEALWLKILEMFDGKDYDFKALLYWGWRLVLKAALNVPLPKKNDWADGGKILCTEMAECLPDEIKEKIGPIDFAMTEPDRLIALIADAVRAILHERGV